MQIELTKIGIGCSIVVQQCSTENFSDLMQTEMQETLGDVLTHNGFLSANAYQMCLAGCPQRRNRTNPLAGYSDVWCVQEVWGEEHTRKRIDAYVNMNTCTKVKIYDKISFVYIYPNEYARHRRMRQNYSNKSQCQHKRAAGSKNSMAPCRLLSFTSSLSTRFTLLSHSNRMFRTSG